MIYLDNAATTRPSALAINTATLISQTNWGNPSSAHDIGIRAKAVLEDSRKKIADVLHCKPSEIFFNSGASEGNAQVIKSFLAENCWVYSVIASSIEHASVVTSTQDVPVDKNGIIELEMLDKLLSYYLDIGTSLASIQWANNEIGTIQPVEQIAEMCKKHEVYFHSDATAIIGHYPIDLSKPNMPDMITFSAHKFHGLKGAGVLYAREGTPICKMIHGGNQERGKRGGTENLPAIAAMAAALEEVSRGIDCRALCEKEMRDVLIEGLLAIDGAHLNGTIMSRTPNNVNIRFDGVSGEALALYLSNEGICVSTGAACHSGKSEPSRTLEAIGLTPQQALESIRITVDADENSFSDVKECVEEIKKGVEMLRGGKA